MSIKPIVSVISAAILLSACGGGTGDTSPPTQDNSPATGRLSVAITDAPVADLASVVVEFTGVTLKPADGDEIAISLTDVNGAIVDTKSIDLKTLTGSASEVLFNNIAVPAGAYHWIRLNVNAAKDGVNDSYVQLTEGGDAIELDIPSGAESGLKLVSGFTVAQGGSSDFTIDFDLSKSITVTKPNSAAPEYKLRPALRLVDNLDVGAISVTVDGTMINEVCGISEELSTNFGAVYLWQGSDAQMELLAAQSERLITTALVDASGTADIGFILSGTYTVGYTCDNALDSVSGVTLVSGTELAANTTVTINGDFGPEELTITENTVLEQQALATPDTPLADGSTAGALIVFHDTQNVSVTVNEVTEVIINQIATE